MRRFLRWLGIAAIILVVLIAIPIAYICYPWPFRLSSGSVASAVVSLEERKVDKAKWPKVEITDPETIGKLVAVLKSAEEAWDHKCAPVGQIRLKMTDGRERVLTYLPGHDAIWYEFRENNMIYKLPREAFVSIMLQLGITVPLDCQ